ncbi:hypothetical protein [Mycolicibacterium smegmatis]|uniref:hypothetical protein n=1 Tax=Mycolicibacterium smegmatis TaxID=1772 RepID=UPI001EFB1F1C|nr:hypothetical protein [Mycolicibacterium smegmatis]ULN34378.1 hypothetical protein KZ781_27005 [Mycolicibacterium smegmatis]
MTKGYAMNAGSADPVLNFEVYVLMTMRNRMTNKKDQLRATLSSHGFSVKDAERVHRQLAESLGDEASRYSVLKESLGARADTARSFGFSSILWPNFDFEAEANDAGLLESARYRHVRNRSDLPNSPRELALWSVDATEFIGHFGPMTGGEQWPLFHELLPAYEEYEFQWDGRRYGAGFSWGLFMYAAEYWD